jgi:hypothetical protein
MTTTRTVKSDTLTGVMTYSTGMLSVGDCYELCCDLNITGLSASTATLTVSRSDAFNNVFPLYETALSTGQLSLDIGPVYSYAVSRCFGDGIQFDIALTGPTPSITATFSLKGKGA